MPVVGVVNVVTVLDRVVPASGSVRVRMGGMGEMGQRVLVVVPLMGGVCMAVVNVVDVVFALDAGVPATRAVVVRVRGVDLMFGGHWSSLLCCTASATMCPTCWSARE